MTAGSSPQLNYQTRKRFRHRRRWLSLVALVAILTCGTIWRSKFLDLLRPHYQVLRLYLAETRVESFADTENRWCYSDDPADTAVLPTSATGAHQSIYSSAPPQNVAGGIPLMISDFATHYSSVDPDHPMGTNFVNGIGQDVKGTIFAHEMMNSDGESRIVVINAVNDGPELRYYIWHPGTAFTPCRFIDRPNIDDDFSLARGDSGDHIRLFSGKIDAKDRSYFTIAGQYNDRAFSIRGHLKSDDTVEFKPDQGWPGNPWIIAWRGTSLRLEAPKRRTAILADDLPPSDDLRDIAFSSDGQSVILLYGDQVVRVACKNGQVVSRTFLDGWLGFAISRHGRYLVVHQSYATLGPGMLWGVREMETGHIVAMNMVSWGDPTMYLSFSPDEKYCSMSFDPIGTDQSPWVAQLWKLPEEKKVGSIPMDRQPIQAMPNGRFLAARIVDPNRLLTPESHFLPYVTLNNAAGTQLNHWDLGRIDWVKDVWTTFPNEDGTSAVAFRSGAVLDIASGSKKDMPYFGPPNDESPHCAVGLHTAAISGPSPDGSTYIRVCQYPDLDVLDRLTAPADFVPVMAISPDDHWLVTAADYGQLDFWDLSKALAPAPATAIH